MPPEYIAALKGFAFLDGVPLAEYVRGIAHDEILTRSSKEVPLFGREVPLLEIDLN
jgi:hypothetical protein